MNQFKAQVVSLIVGVISSVFAAGILNHVSGFDKDDFFCIFLVFLCITFLVYLAIRILSIKTYGIDAIDKPHTTLVMNSQLSNCKESFDFLGVSARTILDAEGGHAIRTKLAHQPNVKLRFLLLDTACEEIGFKRAEDETGDRNNWVAWKKIIQASIDELRLIKSTMLTANIEVRIYKETPIFRSITTDGQFMYVNYYGKDFRPSETCNLRLRRKDISLFIALQSNFERIWESSIKVV